MSHIRDHSGLPAKLSASPATAPSIMAMKIFALKLNLLTETIDFP
jgi:hypothetical protein